MIFIIAKLTDATIRLHVREEEGATDPDIARNSDEIYR